MLCVARIILVTGSLFGALMLGSLTIQIRDLVLYNQSNSVPPGFYMRVDNPVELGRFATVRARDVSPSYTTLRSFDDRDDRFIKRIVAGRGQVVCASGADIWIDGLLVAHRLEHDAQGRALPRWEGCRTLQDEFMLMGDTPDSFDGRYWGPVTAERIEGVWRPTNVSLIR